MVSTVEAPTVPAWPRTIEAVLGLPYALDDNLRTLPVASGIYFAVVNDEAVAYVGMTCSFRQRWRKHHHIDALRQMGSLRVAYIECEYGPVMWQAESAAIRQFWPSLNSETRYRFRYGHSPEPFWPTPEWVAGRPRKP